MQVYPLKQPGHWLASRTNQPEDIKAITVHGYTVQSLPSLTGRRISAELSMAQIVSGLWVCSRYLMMMLDADRSLLGTLYARLPDHERPAFKLSHYGPDLKIDIVIKDQAATNYSRRKGQNTFVFGTQLMTELWLRAYEYEKVARMLRIGNGDVCMEESWWRTVTHEYAHLLAPFYFQQFNYKHSLQHSAVYCRALADVRHRFPFSTFPAIPVMPQVYFEGPDWSADRDLVTILRHDGTWIPSSKPIAKKVAAPTVAAKQNPLAAWTAANVEYAPSTIRVQGNSIILPDGGGLPRRRSK